MEKRSIRTLLALVERFSKDAIHCTKQGDEKGRILNMGKLQGMQLCLTELNDRGVTDFIEAMIANAQDFEKQQRESQGA